MFASIESSNIVGYMNANVRQNLSVQLPTFDGVVATGIDVQSIKPAVAEGETLESGDFVIQFYDQYGIIEKAYTYCFGEDLDLEEDGWYEEDMETLSTEVFDVGEAFNVLSSKGGTLQYAGQVLTVQTVVPVRANLSAQGNFRPTNVEIQSLVPAVPEGASLESGDFVIQFYNQFGIIEKAYTYCFGEDLDLEEDGWYEKDMETLSTKVFASGEGFNVLTTKGGTLTFPALSL